MKQIVIALFAVGVALADPTAMPLSIVGNGALHAETPGGLTLQATVGQSVARFAAANGMRLHTGFWPAAPRVILSAIDDETNPLPTEYNLYAAYPNPFNPSTRIRFAIPRAQDVKLTVFDVTGREVALLVNSHLTAGEYEANWSPWSISSGVYYARLTAGNYSSTQRLYLIK